MVKVIWTKTALDQLNRIVRFISEDPPLSVEFSVASLRTWIIEMSLGLIKSYQVQSIPFHRGNNLIRLNIHIPIHCVPILPSQGSHANI